jgi:hypothetical protein
VTQRDAGIAESDIATAEDLAKLTPRALFNRAVTLSVMRRRMLESMSLMIADATPEIVPPVVARVALGGKLVGFSGVMPGIFEEALATFEHKRPLYLLGGFGGATGVLADAILNGAKRPKELSCDWYQQESAEFRDLVQLFEKFAVPPPLPKICDGFDRLWSFIATAAANPAGVLNTGLSDADTRDLLATRDLNTALRLVRRGLTNQQKLPPVAA